jgi:hypothetical protein
MPAIGLMTLIIDHKKFSVIGAMGAPVLAIVDSLMN